jgi:hypothetical protein
VRRNGGGRAALQRNGQSLDEEEPDAQPLAQRGECLGRRGARGDGRRGEAADGEGRETGPEAEGPSPEGLSPGRAGRPGAA